MLRASIAFFTFGILAYVLGDYNVAGLSLELGRILLGAFFLLAVLGIIISFATGRKPNLPP